MVFLLRRRWKGSRQGVVVVSAGLAGVVVAGFLAGVVTVGVVTVAWVSTVTVAAGGVTVVVLWTLVCMIRISAAGSVLDVVPESPRSITAATSPPSASTAISAP